MSNSVRRNAGAVFLLVCAFAAGTVFGQDVAEGSGDRHLTIPLELSVFDYPFNLVDGYTIPSMTQSQQITEAGALTMHSLIMDNTSGFTFPLGGAVPYLLTFTFDYLYMAFLPFGYSWNHEEWHRAILSRRGIGSYNGVYDFDPFSGTVSVRKVEDADLAELKERHPAEMVRLSSAGGEAQIDLTLRMRSDDFFAERPVRYDLISWWMNLGNTISYLHLSATGGSDDLVEKANKQEGGDVDARDFTGPDFTAWVYDLFRPDEPYSGRGVHPSGAGVDRYVLHSDLTSEEKDFLVLQRNLSLLNLISPQLFGINRFSAVDPITKRPLSFNFAVVHQLTAFGYDVVPYFFLKEGEVNLTFAYHTYVNHEGVYPGIEVSLYRYPLLTGSLKAFVSATVMGWLQPSDLRFKTTEADPGALLRLTASVPVRDRLETFIRGEVKTEGWVAGNAYLDSVVAFQTGLIYRW